MLLKLCNVDFKCLQHCLFCGHLSLVAMKLTVTVITTFSDIVTELT